MKRILIVVLILISGYINSQNSVFGATAGYNSLIASAKFQNASSSSSASGFYIGVFVDIEASDKFSIQPELQFVNSSQDGESGNSLVIPVAGKYHVTEEFKLLFGPQVDIILDDSEGVKAAGIALFAGLAYDISEKVFISTRYALGLNNRLDDDFGTFISEFDPFIDVSDLKVKFNFFQIGLGYRF